MFHNYRLTEAITQAYDKQWKDMVLKVKNIAHMLALGGLHSPADPPIMIRADAVRKFGPVLFHAVRLDQPGGAGGEAASSSSESAGGGGAPQLTEVHDTVYKAWRFIAMAIATEDGSFVAFDTANSAEFGCLAAAGLTSGAGEPVTIDGSTLSSWGQSLYRLSDLDAVFKELKTKLLGGSVRRMSTNTATNGKKRKACGAPSECASCEQLVAAAEEKDAKYLEQVEAMKERLMKLFPTAVGRMNALAKPYLDNEDISEMPADGSIPERVNRQMTRVVNFIVYGNENGTHHVNGAAVAQS